MTATQSTRLINCTWLASLSAFKRCCENFRINQAASINARAMVNEVMTTPPTVTEASPSVTISQFMNFDSDST